MPAILVEAGFLNTEGDNEIFDNNFNMIVDGIANAILGTLDMETVEEEPMYYRVQVGAFRSRENADKLLYELLDQDYPAFLLHDNGLYRVQVGAFMQLGNAIAMEQKLRNAGYTTLITT